ncbi:MAG: hypothetical protein ACHQX1_02905 [Candidatus Micrarchaeales archaeon]
MATAAKNLPEEKPSDKEISDEKEKRRQKLIRSTAKYGAVVVTALLLYQNACIDPLLRRLDGPSRQANSLQLRREESKGEATANSLAKSLNMSSSKLGEYLGIGDNSKTGRSYPVYEGWRGPGKYHFVAFDVTTPYLSNAKMLNNWNYVVTREISLVQSVPIDLRQAVEKSNNPWYSGK